VLPIFQSEQQDELDYFREIPLDGRSTDFSISRWINR